MSNSYHWVFSLWMLNSCYGVFSFWMSDSHQIVFLIKCQIPVVLFSLWKIPVTGCLSLNVKFLLLGVFSLFLTLGVFSLNVKFLSGFSLWMSNSCQIVFSLNVRFLSQVVSHYLFNWWISNSFHTLASLCIIHYWMWGFCHTGGLQGYREGVAGGAGHPGMQAERWPMGPRMPRLPNPAQFPPGKWTFFSLILLLNSTFQKPLFLWFLFVMTNSVSFHFLVCT